MFERRFKLLISAVSLEERFVGEARDHVFLVSRQVGQEQDIEFASGVTFPFFLLRFSRGGISFTILLAVTRSSVKSHISISGSIELA